MIPNKPEYLGFNTKKNSRKREGAGKGQKKYVPYFDLRKATRFINSDDGWNKDNGIDRIDWSSTHSSYL